MIPWLELDTPFPPVHDALTEEDGAAGLLAAGADLSPSRLLDAYRKGIFPWFSEDQPILWWSTDPRMVLYTEEFTISHSLKKILKKVHKSMHSQGPWQVRFDTAFPDVMRACAGKRKQGEGTWISEDIIAGYSALHLQGYAHSTELWLNNQLVAGAYGLCLGRMFFGESMFTHVTDGSKVALAYLVHFLKYHRVALIDCQQETSHLASLGGRSLSRSDFIEHIQRAINEPDIIDWRPRALFDGSD